MFKLKIKSAIFILLVAIGAFIYSKAYARAYNPSSICPVCSGRFGGDQNCVDVNIGGYHSCTEWANGDCEMGAPCEPPPDQ